MSEDRTALIRKLLIAGKVPESDLAQYEGEVWDTAAMQRDFTVEGFAAPFVVVCRKSDGQRGSLEFTGSPRRYFDFSPHKEGCE